MHTDYYENIIQREKDLHGDVEILYDVVYWPVRHEKAQVKPLSEARQKILRFVANGYHEREALQDRLDGPAFAEDLEWLVQHSLLTLCEEPDGRIVFSPSQSSLPLESAAPGDTYDAINHNKLRFPSGTILLQPQDLVSTIPILVGKDFVPDPETQYYVECLLMLILSPRTKARTTRVYYRQEEVPSLQEILYDFVLDESERLANTKLAAQAVTSSAATISGPSAPSKQITVPEPITAAKPRKGPKLKKPTLPIPIVTAKPATPEVPARSQIITVPVPTSTPRVKIISGRAQHEEALEEAFRSARQQIVIVTPFIRRRISDPGFQQRLATALQRGVDVRIIHGMPNQTENFDDTPHENRRIGDLARSLGRCQSRLKFVRVTGEGSSSTAGEHSKILVCDGGWAVVTSFNWLSFQETNETGVWVEHQESVADLLSLFSGYLEQATTGEETRQEVQAAWPTSTMSKRQWSEWHYGDYNSQ